MNEAEMPSCKTHQVGDGPIFDFMCCYQGTIIMITDDIIDNF